mgnify:CR=1 FL=1
MSSSTTAARAFAVPGLLIVLIIAVALSLLVGAKPLPFSVVIDAFTGTCQSADCTIVLDARLPRTLAGLLAGASTPTRLAIDWAEAAGLTLIGRARAGSFDLYTHPQRIRSA